MPTKLEDVTFYGCRIPKKELNIAQIRDKANKGSLSLSDTLLILIHNQTIMNEKLNDLLKNQGRGRN